MPPIEPNTAHEAPLPVARLQPVDDDPGYELVGDAERPRRMALWVRGLLLCMAAGFAVVLGIALWLDPYNADGSPRNMATHTQLGLPPCNMVQLTGKPCPMCGMTTSFSLLAHGDLAASVRANWCGTLLATYWLLLIPWAIIAAVRGKMPLVKSGEALLTTSVALFLGLSFVRWVTVLLQ